MHHFWLFSSLSWPFPNVFLSQWWPISTNNRNLSVCVGHWLISEGFHGVISRLSLFWHLSLHVPSPFSPTITYLSLRLAAIHLCVCGCKFQLSPGLCVFIFYRCVFSCVHTLPVENALSHTRINWGSGPTVKEVGGCIDKAVNEVIGRINGDPKGTMSISACRGGCLSVCLSVCSSRRVGCYRRQRQSVTQGKWAHKQNVIHNRAGHGLCCCSLPHPSIWQDNGTAWHNTEHWLPLWGQSKDWDTIHVVDHSPLQTHFLFYSQAFLEFILTILWRFFIFICIMWRD